MSEILHLIQSKQGEATVYLLSLPPVEPYVTVDYPVFTLRSIHNLNRILRNLATYHRVEYLDIYSLLSDPDGSYARHADSRDGLHFYKGGCDIVKDYLLRHTTV